MKSTFDPRDPSAGPLTDGTLLEPLTGFRRSTPRWVREEGFILIGAWESIQFYQRSNQASTDFKFLYERSHTEDFIQEAQAIGANCIVTHYDYTFGVEEQKEQLAKSKAFIELCHRHGMKAGVYFRVDSLGHEALVGAEREMLKYVQRDDRGPVGFTPYLHGLCYHYPEAVDWLKKWIHCAVVEFRTDILHFDGFIFGGMEGMGVACRCSKCRADFRDFLVEKYGNDPDTARERFGHTQVQNIEPPMRPDGLTRQPGVPRGAIHDVVWQEWIQFRCLWSTHLARLIAQYVHSLDPNVAIEINSCQGVRENDALNYGFDHPTYAGLFDAYWAEDGYGPKILPTGELISRIRHCKYVRNNGGSLLTYVQGETPRELRQVLAHNLAFNAGSIGCLGFTPGLPFSFLDFADEKREFATWRRDRADCYRDVQPISDVAVWRGQKSLAFGAGVVACASMRVEQFLIEERIPFNLVSDEWLERPGPERVLILPDVECVTQPQADAIARLVRAGGGLIAAQDSSRFDGWRRRRPDLLLRDLLGPEAGRDGAVQRAMVTAEIPAGCVNMADRGRRGQVMTQHTCGQGRAVYLPEIMQPDEQRPTVDDHFRYDFGLDFAGWRLPACAAELSAALNWCLNGPPRIRVEAERGVVAEFGWQPNARRYLIHLVNLRADLTRAIRITLQLPASKAFDQLDVFSPDAGGAGACAHHARDRQLTIELGQLDVYAVVAITMKTQSR